MQQAFNVLNINNFYTIVIIVMPILNIYSAGVSTLGIGDVLAIFSFLLLMFSTKGRIKINNNKYFYFAVYFVMVSFFLLLLLPEYSIWQFFSKCLRFGLYTVLIICFAKDNFNINFGLKNYIYICFFASCYLLIQYLFKSFFSISLPILIPFLNVMYSDITGAVYSEELLQGYSIFGYRAPGFFKEPAHFCQYVMPSIVFLLFSFKSGIKRNIALILIIASIVVSFSAIGYISLLATLFVWYIYTFKHRLITNNLVILFLGVCVVVYISISTGAFSSALSRIETIQYTHAATGNLRLLRGFYVYNEIPFIYKIFGIGCGNYSAFIDKYSISTFFDLLIDKHNEYMSTISCILVNSGIFGMALYFIFLRDIYKHMSLIQKVLFVDFVVILVATSSFYSASYVMYMVFLIISLISNYKLQFD